MLNDLMAAGGPGFLIPAALFMITVYVTRGLFGLYGSKQQSRREFLEIWNPDRINDDFWLEVTVRHLFGTYLPAPVIRIALKQSCASQSLIELAGLWGVLHYDSVHRTVRWKSSNPYLRKVRLCIPVVLYFSMASLGIAFCVLAYASNNLFARWLYSVAALILGSGAILSLAESDAAKIARHTGEQWIDRINAVAASNRSLQKQK